MKLKVLTGIIVLIVSIAAILATASKTHNSTPTVEEQSSETTPEMIERVAQQNFVKKPKIKQDGLNST
ncbi:hypothetical protein N9L02_03835 [Gammaproteobacteria bacterium]|nr:hypothetical protein [Gammaproteobacteria bacterium]